MNNTTLARLITILLNHMGIAPTDFAFPGLIFNFHFHIIFDSALVGKLRLCKNINIKILSTDLKQDTDGIRKNSNKGDDILDQKWILKLKLQNGTISLQHYVTLYVVTLHWSI